ncbi:hypothetical protein SDC9_95649 [bioreactor metagenome]|uniref:Uncharacterized protein n=1 Tax=bioreactor metagenome TaxID=1076179 RepID=A0A645A736_9ZZZZ
MYQPKEAPVEVVDADFKEVIEDDPEQETFEGVK